MSAQGTHTIGLKVVAQNTGKEIAHVHDIIYDPVLNQISALLIDNGGWFSDAKVILMSDVNTVGVDAVIVPSEDVIRKAHDVSSRVKNIAEDNNYLTKTKVITEDGTELGHVSDLMFDPQNGNVTHLIISSGFLKNVGTGHKTVAIGDIKTVGEDAMIVTKYTEQKVEEQTGGVLGTLSQATDKAKDVAANARDKATELASTAKDKTVDFGQSLQSGENRDKIDEVSDNLAQKLREGVSTVSNFVQDKTQQTKEGVDQTKEKIQTTRKNDAVGKYAKVNILNKNNEQIIAIGDMVDYNNLSQAQTNDMLEKLLGNLSDTPVTVVPKTI